MTPILLALVASGVVTQADAERIDRQLDPNAARLWAEEILTQSFERGLTAQQRRILTVLNEAQGQPTPQALARLWAQEDELLWRDVRDDVVSVAIDRGIAASISAADPNTWMLVNEEVVNAVDIWYLSDAAESFGSIPNLNTTSRQQFAEAFQAWQLGDRTPGNYAQGLPQLINELMPTFGRQRARVVGVTETTRLFSIAEQASAMANPEITYLQWLTAEDELVCPICGPRANRIVGKESDGFRAATDSTVGFPPAHPNCRCSIASLTAAAYGALSNRGMVRA